MEDGELLPKAEIFEGKRAARFESVDEPAKERPYHPAIVTLACGEDQEGRARMNKQKAQPQEVRSPRSSWRIRRATPRAGFEISYPFVARPDRVLGLTRATTR